MNGKIADKIAEIERYLLELGSFSPATFHEYEKNIEKKAASERYFEKIVEASVDLAFLIIKEDHLTIPEEEKETFDLLTKEGIISVELAAKLKNAKGMRNILAHEYGIVDDSIVFASITEELNEDIGKFLEMVNSYQNRKLGRKKLL